MTSQCEFYDKPNVDNHLLECEMVLSHYFEGTTSLVCEQDTNFSLVSTVKKPGKLPILRWKTILELCEDLVKSTNPPKNAMYA